MPFAIAPSLPSNGIKPRDSYRGSDSRTQDRDVTRETDSFRAGRSRPEQRGDVRAPDSARGGQPFSSRDRDTVRETDSYRPARAQPPQRSDVRGSDRARGGQRTTPSFQGAQVDYQSEESASLEVKTDDGDTVNISFAALSRIRAGAYSAQADGSTASSQSVSAESAFNVQVKVKGSLDDKEVSQIGELLQRLVSTARSGQPQAVQTNGLESLDTFQFAYNAYQQASRATLEARAK